MQYVHSQRPHRKMTVRIINPKTKTMSDKEIKEALDAFLALPKAERRVAYSSLPREVQLKARKVIEARRGIAYRDQAGAPVITADEYIRQICQKQEKVNDSERRETVLKESIVSLKRDLLENHGEEALTRAEAALEALTANA